ncbi:hypothetical protein I6A84_14750 [Frankia sp. CNm7]|uniref:Uncharacterized protein n=1 Tax=Frankia nepalensis TaxID=1836974 RepID=A0A937R8X6_9ACTN|nr:hypothetical protein [Frankia nepalensis]MBL7499119.1 hypothetical protein [Frankia nepalensis]MBL7513868.1 hypothetical protein [Frankia nepalensis]MBL7519328.1 hypothetical protein [Frankia nepalensis]MBL7625912.1 hypothetical protein [Frankia nepalensis]
MARRGWGRRIADLKAEQARLLEQLAALADSGEARESANPTSGERRDLREPAPADGDLAPPGCADLTELDELQGFASLLDASLLEAADAARLADLGAPAGGGPDVAAIDLGDAGGPRPPTAE